jgi:transcriptional regulator with XRE-family HTH domain
MAYSKGIKGELKRVDLKVDSDFQKALQFAQRLLEMSDREIGDALSVSRPSVNRWMNGANLPYNAMRKGVFDWIEKSLGLIKLAMCGLRHGFTPAAMIAQIESEHGITSETQAKAIVAVAERLIARQDKETLNLSSF